jgi:hypothetical protein
MKYYLIFGLILNSLYSKGQTITEINLASEMDNTVFLDNGQEVNLWGFGLIKPNGSFTSKLPGPVLEINKGDSVVINLFNASQEFHTIHLHGLDVNQANDGVPTTSFQVGPTETGTYTFNANHSGTYLYHCHVLTTLHLTMGMYGMIVVNNFPESNKIFENGPTFTNEYRLLTSDMDESWNAGTIVTIPEFYFFKSDYFMVNGKSGNQLYNSAENQIQSYVGDSTLLRLGSMAYNKTRYIFPPELNAKAYMSDGRVLTNAFDCDTLIVNSGERFTVLLTPSENINTDVLVEYYEARNNNLEHINRIKLNGDLSITEGVVGEYDIYPNPTNDIVTFRTLVPGDILQIYDLSGKPIVNQLINDITTKLDISDLNDGIYVLKYQDTTLKVVKQ